MFVKYINIRATSNYFPNDCSLNFNELIKQVAIKLNEENSESNYIINDKTVGNEANTEIRLR